MIAPITSVTVLEDRAAVTRRGRVALAVGQHRLIVERVAPVLVDKTLTATAVGARVLDVRCERYLAPWRDPGVDAADAVAALHAERLRLETERDAAQVKLAVARAEIAALGEVAATAVRDLAVAATTATTPPGALAQLAALDADEAAARERRVSAELVVRELQAALGRLDVRIAEAETEAGEQAARLVIDVHAEAAGEIALAIGYVVPGAAWRPYHRAVLTRATPERPARVEWQTTACVWQATGEAWTGVELVCSLERPSLGVEPPVLTDDELAARRRPDSVTVEAREQEQHTTGLGSEGPPQVPGIDDGGLGLTLAAPRATIAADGAPHRVPVGSFASDAIVELVAIPLRSPWVHVRARLANTAATPLLAGPVDLVMASGYVGRGEIGFVAAGERFALGFGPQADVRVHRSETRERDEAGLLGGWNVSTVRVAVRLSNLGRESREVIVTERVPVSEVEQVAISVSAPTAYRLGSDGEPIVQTFERAIDERGLVTWSVALLPLAHGAVTLEYLVKSQRGVAGV